MSREMKVVAMDIMLLSLSWFYEFDWGSVKRVCWDQANVIGRVYVNVEVDVDVVRRCTSGLIRIESIEEVVEVELNG